MATVLIENSSFVNTTMRQTVILETSIIHTDFRQSLFEEVRFRKDVDIQVSNFSNSKFKNCHLGRPHITETFFL
jgi:uncharacterized protein YjbI with pentapeptide repeats